MEVEEFLNKYSQGIRDFTGVNLTEANLSGINLSGANLSEANLSISNLSGANLSQVNLTQAKLNVARLSGANLTQANLSGAILNVANLARADLREADLYQAAMIRTELIRAELSGANLSETNLTGADLGEARLRLANLRGANLSEANLRGTSLTGANLQQANLHGAELSRADLSGTDLRGAELRQANLGMANLTGADLRGANLRWADLSGVNLRWANLSEAKLSGANLSGADLSNANLMNTSLVHADLSQANLIQVDWIGADLTGANLTGAKLYAVSRFGLKTEGINCEWVDLSPDGDQSQIYRLSAEEARKFFHQTSPTIRIVVDTSLDQQANFILAATYYKISQEYSIFTRPASIEVGERRTTITLRIDSDEQLFLSAYLAVNPFENGKNVQEHIRAISEIIQEQAEEYLLLESEKTELEKITNYINQTMKNIKKIKTGKYLSKNISKIDFFKAPTQITLTNSSEQALNIYQDFHFGKRFVIKNIWENLPDQITDTKLILPPTNLIFDFLKNSYL